ncbi:MAG: hypothetical protein FWE38_05460 [Firmicutes bacterium]|nr:hypothetical protein [Bacillota bacterium]
MHEKLQSGVGAQQPEPHVISRDIHIEFSPQTADGKRPRTVYISTAEEKSLKQRIAEGGSLNIQSMTGNASSAFPITICNYIGKENARDLEDFFNNVINSKILFGNLDHTYKNENPYRENTKMMNGRLRTIKLPLDDFGRVVNSVNGSITTSGMENLVGDNSFIKMMDVVEKIESRTKENETHVDHDNGHDNGVVAEIIEPDNVPLFKLIGEEFPTARHGTRSSSSAIDSNADRPYLRIVGEDGRNGGNGGPPFVGPRPSAELRLRESIRKMNASLRRDGIDPAEFLPPLGPSPRELRDRAQREKYKTPSRRDNHETYYDDREDDRGYRTSYPYPVRYKRQSFGSKIAEGLGMLVDGARTLRERFSEWIMTPMPDGYQTDSYNDPFDPPHTYTVTRPRDDHDNYDDTRRG